MTGDLRPEKSSTAPSSFQTQIKVTTEQQTSHPGSTTGLQAPNPNDKIKNSSLGDPPIGEVLKTERGFALPPGLLDWWQGQFPKLDVAATLRYIAEYARTRPEWARRKRNWRLVILNWLKLDSERIIGLGHAGVRRSTLAGTLEEHKAEVVRTLKGNR